MENIRLENSLSRRNFLKGVAAGAAALGIAAAAPSIAPLQKAFAAQSATAAELTAGTYTVSANMYVKREDHQAPIVFGPAYLTNPNNPLELGGLPTTPVEGNGTLIVNENGSYTVTIPVVNECFSLVSIEAGSGMSYLNTTTTYCSYMPDDEYGQQRISQVVVTLASQADEYQFGACREYAAFPLKKGYHDWPIYLSVDFAGATPQ